MKVIQDVIKNERKKYIDAAFKITTNKYYEDAQINNYWPKNATNITEIVVN